MASSDPRGLSSGAKLAVVLTVIALIAVVFALRQVPKAERPSTQTVITTVETIPAKAP